MPDDPEERGLTAGENETWVWNGEKYVIPNEAEQEAEGDDLIYQGPVTGPAKIAERKRCGICNDCCSSEPTWCEAWSVPEESDPRAAADEETQPFIPETMVGTPPSEKLRAVDSFALQAQLAADLTEAMQVPAELLQEPTDKNAAASDPSMASSRWQIPGKQRYTVEGKLDPVDVQHMAKMIAAFSEPPARDAKGEIVEGAYHATVPIQVERIEVGEGTVTLAEAPEHGSRVTFTYKGAPYPPETLPLWKRLREWFFDTFRIYFHAHATDEDQGVSFLRAGRWWLTFNSARTRAQEELHEAKYRAGKRPIQPHAHAEWRWFPASFRPIGLNYEVDPHGDNGQHQFSFHLYLLNAYLTLKDWPIPPLSWLLRAAKPPRTHHRITTDRHIGFLLVPGDGWSLSWRLWWPDSAWVRGDPRWRSGFIFLTDVLWGRAQYTTRTDHESDHEMFLPEGIYPVHVKLFTSTWTRPRDPFNLLTRTMRRAEVTATQRAPSVPGKGENAWDCDDTAVYSITCPAETIGDAIEAYRTSILSTRTKHGGKGWKPGKSFPVQR